MFWFVSLAIPGSIGIAILRYDLFEIDIVINRTLVYGILTAIIIALYIGVISFLGILVQAQTSVLSGLIATGVVAVIFQPLRERLQKLVNRVLYGQRDEPAMILSQLAQHIESTDSPATTGEGGSEAPAPGCSGAAIGKVLWRPAVFRGRGSAASLRPSST